MFARIYCAAAAIACLVAWMLPAKLEAQQRQPQRLVQRPEPSVQYGFPASGVNTPPNTRVPAVGNAPRTAAPPRRGPVQPVNYLRGPYPGQDAVQGEAVEMLPQPLLMDPTYSDPSPYYNDGSAYYDDPSAYYDDSYAGGYHDGGYHDGGYEWFGSCFAGNCGDNCDPHPECFWRGLGGLISNADFRTGVHGFKNSANRQQDGSFGFHGGVNLGLPLKRLTCGLFSGSLGVNSVQSNFSGSSFTDENRNQLFATAAMFRRVDQGLQGGVAYDYLREDWYSNYGISQLRSELSWVTERANSFGFRYTKAQASFTTNSVLANQTTLSENWVALRQYRMFFRKSVHDGEGYIEFNAGHTDEKHAILALDFNTPLRGAARFYGGFTYLIPQDTILNSTDGQETWNVAMGIQFSPYRRRGFCRFNLPLFDVADNGTFQVRRTTN